MSTFPATVDAVGSESFAVAQAMASARVAQPHWSRTPLTTRLNIIRDLRRLIVENAHDLAFSSASARQRPVLESMTAEVLPLVEACRFLERNARKVLSSRRVGSRGKPLWLAGVRSEIHREPLGVVLIIGPGNYPLLLPGVQLIQALAAGNAVLLKPGAGGTPAARALCALIVRAGFDPRLVALLTETPDTARAAIAARPDKVLFTGSADTGEKILDQLAPKLIPAALELSGCDAVLVRSDADLELVARALSFGLRLNAGAVCISPKRVFVHRNIATELEGRLALALRASRAGECPASIQSQHILLSAVSGKLRAALEDAFARGAHLIASVITDGEKNKVSIILGGVSPASTILREDLFSPVLSIVTVADDEEAVLRINDCPFALAASIFTRDESAALSIATGINTGVITINDVIIPTADARLPFGGRKRSGFGVTRGAEGLLELTIPKVVTVSRGKFRPAYDPAQPGDEKMFNSYLRLAHGRGLKSRCAALISFLRSISQRSGSTPKDNK